MNKKDIAHTVVIVMGVSGCGKTTIGTKLSEKIEIPFYDADAFHPKENVEKMKNGHSLNDKDRQPWLLTLANNIKEWSVTEGAVLACSALKETYRDILSSKFKNINWVYLSGSQDLIKTRMEQRVGHFMKSDLLQCQFNDLEIPKYGIHIDIEQSPDEIIQEIISKLNTDD